MTREEYAQVCDYLRSLLLPDGIAVTFNGDRLLPRKPIHTFQASLETQIADEKGIMRPTTRKTLVSLYEPLPGEVPSPVRNGPAHRGNRRQMARFRGPESAAQPGPKQRADRPISRPCVWPC